MFDRSFACPRRRFCAWLRLVFIGPGRIRGCHEQSEEPRERCVREYGAHDRDEAGNVLEHGVPVSLQGEQGERAETAAACCFGEGCFAGSGFRCDPLRLARPLERAPGTGRKEGPHRPGPLGTRLRLFVDGTETFPTRSASGRGPSCPRCGAHLPRSLRSPGQTNDRRAPGQDRVIPCPPRHCSCSEGLGSPDRRSSSMPGGTSTTGTA